MPCADEDERRPDPTARLAGGADSAASLSFRFFAFKVSNSSLRRSVSACSLARPDLSLFSSTVTERSSLLGGVDGGGVGSLLPRLLSTASTIPCASANASARASSAAAFFFALSFWVDFAGDLGAVFAGGAGGAGLARAARAARFAGGADPAFGWDWPFVAWDLPLVLSDIELPVSF